MKLFAKFLMKPLTNFLEFLAYQRNNRITKILYHEKIVTYNS